MAHSTEVSEINTGRTVGIRVADFVTEFPAAPSSVSDALPSNFALTSRRQPGDYTGVEFGLDKSKKIP